MQAQDDDALSAALRAAEAAGVQTLGYRLEGGEVGSSLVEAATMWRDQVRSHDLP